MSSSSPPTTSTTSTTSAPPAAAGGASSNKGGPGMVAVVDPTSEPSREQLTENFKSVQERVTAAMKSGNRAPDSVQLVAVSKTKSVGCLQRAYDAGVRVFGENYVQEIVEKAPQLPKDIEWRFIGHLQSNKAKDVISKVGLGLSCIETVDSENLANKLNAASVKYRIPGGRPPTPEGGEGNNNNKKPKKGKDSPPPQGEKEQVIPLRVMVQVNTSGEDSKSGVAPTEEAIVPLCRHIIQNCPGLVLDGLMTIGMPDFSPNPECFNRLVACRGFLVKAFPDRFHATAEEKREGAAEKKEEEGSSSSPSTTKLCRLSMGMSGDFENAILAGSNNVRVGSSIFGARVYKQKESAPLPPQPKPEEAKTQ